MIDVLPVEGRHLPSLIELLKAKAAFDGALNSLRATIFESVRLARLDETALRTIAANR